MNNCVLKEKVTINEKKNYKKDVINIGYGIDDNYVRPMAASIVSFLLNNRDREIVVNIISADLCESNISKLKILALKFNITINYYHISNDFLDTFPVNKIWPQAMYYRFLLPYFIENTEYIYYFDADVICVKNCSELFDASIGCNVLGAVVDVEKTRKKRERCLGLEGRYFNSGVLVINIKQWIKESMLEKLISVLKANSESLKYPDQDALNMILDGKYYRIDNRFNTMEITDAAINDCVILHFANHPKPWTDKWILNPLYDTMAKNFYDDYEKNTPWKYADKTKEKLKKEAIKWIIKRILFYCKRVICA